MGRSIGVLTTHYIWVGNVEGTKLGATRVYPEPGRQQFDLKAVPPDEIVDRIVDLIDGLREGEPLDCVGAGFPGIPIKLRVAGVSLTLVESKQKKATFLREALRTLDLKDAQVFAGRAEDFVAPGQSSLTVTLRAVEQFEEILPVTAQLVTKAGNGRLALLVGEAQVTRAREILPEFTWRATVAIPQSEQRVLLVGERAES